MGKHTEELLTPDFPGPPLRRGVSSCEGLTSPPDLCRLSHMITYALYISSAALVYGAMAARVFHK